MTHCKVAVIGAGSYVFGPSVLNDAILTHQLPGLELALVDVDGETLERMAGVARRMARETGTDTRVTTHTDRKTALDGADFVICSASPQMWRRFGMDCEIIDRHIPGHLVTEFGGVAGISYSLRQIALIEGIAEDMQRLCPDAWLLNVANPLPRVCQAAQERGIKTAGFCSVSIQGYGMISRLLDGEPSAYPFARPQEKYEAAMAGVNHFSWLCELRDRQTGEDLLPILRRRILEGATSGHPHAEQIARETGYLLMPGDDHIRDFLAPEGAAHRLAPGHGSPDDRQKRLDLLRDIGEGRQAWDELLRKPSWEKPVDVIAALAYHRPARIHSLNLINNGQIADLPRNVFVETACDVDSSGLTPGTP